jgi:hypothetical protein
MILGAFLRPSRHLSLDHPGVPPLPARPELLTPDLVEQASVPRIGPVIGRLRQLALQHAQRVDERDSVGVLARHHRRVVDFPTDGGRWVNGLSGSFVLGR